MSNDLTLAEVPIEVLLDNLLPFVQVPDILRLARTSKVRFLWTSNLINPYMSSGSSFQFFVLTIPCGSENYNRTSISPVKQLRGQVAGNLFIEAFIIHEVGSFFNISSLFMRLLFSICLGVRWCLIKYVVPSPFLRPLHQTLAKILMEGWVILTTRIQGVSLSRHKCVYHPFRLSVL